MPDHTITIDLKGLELTEEQFQEIQASLHQTMLAHVAKLPPFRAEGINIRPIRPGGGGPLINGILIDRLHGQIGNPGGQP